MKLPTMTMLLLGFASCAQAQDLDLFVLEMPTDWEMQEAQTKLQMSMGEIPQMKSNVVPMMGIPASETGCSTVHGCEEEIIETFVRQHLVWNGDRGLDWTRPGAWFGGIYFTFIDKRTLMPVKIFLKDTFTLQFEDKSTIEVEFLGPYAPSGNFFQYVWETAKAPPVYPTPVSNVPRERIDISAMANWDGMWLSMHSWGIQHFSRNQR